MDQPCPRCPASPSELRRGIGRFVGVGNRGMLLVFGLPRSGAVGERSRKVCALCRARHNAANSTLSLWPMPRLAPSARNDSLLFPGQRHPVFPASDRAARIRFLHSVRSRLDSRSWVLIGPDWPGFTDPPYLTWNFQQPHRCSCCLCTARYRCVLDNALRSYQGHPRPHVSSSDRRRLAGLSVP